MTPYRVQVTVRSIECSQNHLQSREEETKSILRNTLNTSESLEEAKLILRRNMTWRAWRDDSPRFYVEVISLVDQVGPEGLRAHLFKTSAFHCCYIEMIVCIEPITLLDLAAGAVSLQLETKDQVSQLEIPLTLHPYLAREMSRPETRESSIMWAGKIMKYSMKTF